MKKKHIVILFIIITLYTITNTLFLANESYLLSVLPVVFIFLYAMFFYTKQIVYFTFFLVPLSINLKLESVNIIFPTELIIFSITVLFLAKLLLNNNYDYKILKHPFSIIIILHLLWIFITSITSSMPIVSFKFLLSRTWYVVVFYFIIINYFTTKKDINNFFYLYLTSLILVILFITYKHSAYFFTRASSNMPLKPFFNDHTLYGAVTAFFTPYFLFTFFYAKKLKITGFTYFLHILGLIIINVGLFLSYSRAAWLSLIVSLFIFIIIRLKIKFATLSTLILLAVAIILMNKNTILIEMERNKISSGTKKGNVETQIKSISNIKNDDSNTERINRWNSAIRMFKEKPVFGWGPGTYMFKYAPFQLSSEKTSISTNRGILGNAHSEYLGPLSEQGLFGLVFIFILLSVTIYKGLKIYYRNDNDYVKIMTLIILTGLVSYFSHGVLNNFLDTDKASIPFWTFLAIMTVLDIYPQRFKD